MLVYLAVSLLVIRPFGCLPGAVDFPGPVPRLQAHAQQPSPVDGAINDVDDSISRDNPAHPVYPPWSRRHPLIRVLASLVLVYGRRYPAAIARGPSSTFASIHLRIRQPPIMNPAQGQQGQPQGQPGAAPPQQQQQQPQRPAMYQPQQIRNLPMLSEDDVRRGLAQAQARQKAGCTSDAHSNDGRRPRRHHPRLRERCRRRERREISVAPSRPST